MSAARNKMTLGELADASKADDLKLLEFAGVLAMPLFDRQGRKGQHKE